VENIIKYVAITGCIIGSLNFLIRFIYFGSRKSFDLEFKKMNSAKYFLLINPSEVNENKENVVRILLNIMLKLFYTLFIITMISTLIFTLSETRV